MSASRVSASPVAARPPKTLRTFLGRLLRSRPILYAVNAAGLRSGDPSPLVKNSDDQLRLPFGITEVVPYAGQLQFGHMDKVP